MLRGLRKKALILLISSATQLRSSDSSRDMESYNKVIKQVHDFEIALQAMDYLLDDRATEGVDLLKDKLKEHQDSKSDQPAAIFPLALGVMEFIEATLGFESEVMAKAHNTLSDAESASLNNSKYNAKHQLNTSHIYPPGTEFQVTYAELTLLNALVMLLQENNGMVENAKALFKLRRAYQILDSTYKKIKDLEPAFNRNIAKLRKQSDSVNVSTVDLPGYNSSVANSTASLAEDVKLMKNLETVFQMRKARIEGTNMGNGVDPAKVNLFEGYRPLDSSLNLPTESSGTYANLFKRTPSVSSFSKSGTPETRNIYEKPPLTLGDQNGQEEQDDDDDDDFSDAYEDPSEYSASVGDISCSNQVSVLSFETQNSKFSKSDNYLHVSTIDEFIHSGVQLCFGILQVVLSLIPPAIGKVLSIVGFKGDREKGLKMLWRTAITSRNIHGELALLCLLVFYDGPVQFVDDGYQVPSERDNAAEKVISLESKTVISDSELEQILKNPSLYTPQILARTRRSFPNSAIWVLEEGRILAGQGKLEAAIDIMQNFTDNPETKIQMKQAEALLLFDRAMLYSFKHEYDKAAEDFINLVELNSWSKGLYLFMAGCCYLTKWRMIKMGLLEVEDKEKELKKYEELAQKYMEKGPTYVPGHGINAKNKKGGIGGGSKQMPFDKFLLRKMSHIEARQKKDPNLSFVECVGTSPFHELLYFWNGYNRMSEKELKLSLDLLGYSAAPNTDYSANSNDLNYSKVEENVDESMIRYFLQSICLRLLGKVSEGLSLIENHVISKYVVSDAPQFKFTKMTYSPYLYPTALYEKAMFIWILRSRSSKTFNVRETALESKSWLKKAETVADIGDFELSNRTSMRIKASGDRLEQLAREHT